MVWDQCKGDAVLCKCAVLKEWIGNTSWNRRRGKRRGGSAMRLVPGFANNARPSVTPSPSHRYARWNKMIR